jgi:hypothetical protein
MSPTPRNSRLPSTYNVQLVVRHLGGLTELWHGTKRRADRSDSFETRLLGEIIAGAKRSISFSRLRRWAEDSVALGIAPPLSPFLPSRDGKQIFVITLQTIYRSKPRSPL